MAGSSVIDGIDYGPLAVLVGRWWGDKGVDRAPEPDGEERNPFYETIEFEAIGDVTNAEEQTLALVRYHQVVSRKSNDEVFHDQVGFWSWDATDNTLTHSFVIPRGVAVVAEGTLAAPSDPAAPVTFSVATDRLAVPIAQSNYMTAKAATTAFSLDLVVTGDTMQYTQTTVLDIYGRSEVDHTDLNTLERQA